MRTYHGRYWADTRETVPLHHCPACGKFCDADGPTYRALFGWRICPDCRDKAKAGSVAVKVRRCGTVDDKGKQRYRYNTYRAFA